MLTEMQQDHGAPPLPCSAREMEGLAAVGAEDPVAATVARRWWKIRRRLRAAEKGIIGDGRATATEIRR
jgi:hypothetical protein